MASEESLMINSSSILEEEYDDTDDGFHYQTRQNSLSRLSICTSSFHEDDEDDLHPSELGTFISAMSLESLDDDVGAEADGEISDDDGDESDSDKESSGFYTLSTIAARRRRKASEESEMKIDGSNKGDHIVIRKRREKSKRGNHQYGHGFNGVDRDSDGDGNRYGGAGELTVLTKVRGGKKSMKMGFEEVIACRDLGFDLEVPGRVSISAGSNRETQTSSGGNSPIANWRISSPGDDPKEVKARLKMWAQAVALASASR